MSCYSEKAVILQSDNYHHKYDVWNLIYLPQSLRLTVDTEAKTDVLAAYFSEFALIKYRVQVEIEYFITLCELPLPQLKGVDKGVFETLRNIYR